MTSLRVAPDRNHRQQPGSSSPPAAAVEKNTGSSALRVQMGRTRSAFTTLPQADG